MCNGVRRRAHDRDGVYGVITDVQCAPVWGDGQHVRLCSTTDRDRVDHSICRGADDGDGAI